MSKILLIEDDKDLNELLSLRLKAQGYEVLALFDFANLSDVLDSHDIDLVIADRNLPSGDILPFVLTLRKRGYDEPMIFLTAKTLQSDILQGFESGCDDYITKPFDFNELALRIKALLKRSKKQSEKLNFKEFSLDLENHELFMKGEKIKISNLDFELLRCFFENKGVLLSRHFLSENVWQNDNISDKSINIAITRLRNKIPLLKEHIQSVRGVGYKLG